MARSVPAATGPTGWSNASDAAATATQLRADRTAAPCARAVTCGRHYLCPTCGEAGRIYEKGRCFRCTVQARLRDTLADPSGEIPQQLHPLVTALLAADKPRSVLVWLGKSPAAGLLREIATRTEPLSHQVLDGLPPTQHVDYLRNLLVHTGILPARIDQLDRLTPWLDQNLAAMTVAHARLIRPFAAWDLLHRARRRAIRRGVFTASAAGLFRRRIRAAVDLLTALDADGVALADLRQPWLDQWLTSRPPSRYTARSFVQWINERHLARHVVAIPTRRPAAPSVFLDQDEQTRQLERCLGDEQLPVDVRAAGALILLFGITLSQVRTLYQGQLVHKDPDLFLAIGRHELIVPPRLARLLCRLPAPTIRPTVPSNPTADQPLFPGRLPGRPMVTQSLSNRLKDHGVLPRAGRNTALIALAADLPASVVADLLGLDNGAAVRWATYAKRDWHGYLADRRFHGVTQDNRGGRSASG